MPELDEVAFGARRRVLVKPEPNKYLSIGITELDNALGGGLLRGGLTEFCGQGASTLACNALDAVASSNNVTLLVVGGGSGIGRSNCAKHRLAVPNIWHVVECLSAIRRDGLAMQTIGGPLADVVLIDGLTRMLDACLGTGGPFSRAKVRAETCHIATSLRELVVDTNCSVLIVSSSPIGGIRRMWEQVLDTRVDTSQICSERGCQHEYIRESDDADVYRRVCYHISARVTRKHGVSNVCLLNLTTCSKRWVKN